MEDLDQQKLFLYDKAKKRIEELETETASLKRRLASAEGRVRAAASSEASEPREDEDALDEIIRDLQRLRRKLKRAPWRETDDPVCDAFGSMIAQNIAQARNSARKMRKHWPPEVLDE